MREMIRADWYRARCMKMIPLLILEAVAAALVFLYALHRMRATGYKPDMGPAVPGAYLLIAGFAASVTCGIAEEQDFASGGLRNKLVTGHTRAQAYWSSYIVNTIVAFLIAAVYLGVLFGITAPWVSFDGAQMAAYLAQGITGIAAFTAMYSLVGVVWGRRGITVGCMLVVIVMFVVSNIIANGLLEPEFYDPEVVAALQTIGEFTETEAGELVRNSSYVAEPVRSVYVFFDRFLPTGQALQLAQEALDGPLNLYALGFSACCWTASLIVLRRKNLT